MPFTFKPRLGALVYCLLLAGCGLKGPLFLRQSQVIFPPGATTVPIPATVAPPPSATLVPPAESLPVPVAATGVAAPSAATLSPPPRKS